MLSLCIALATSTQGVAAPLPPATPNCPADLKTLTDAQRDALPEPCRQKAPEAAPSGEGTGTLLLTLGGLVVAGVGVAAGAGSGGGGSLDDPTPVPSDDPGKTLYVYDNGVTLDTRTKTLTFGQLTVNNQIYYNTAFTYIPYGSDYQLTAPDGKTLMLTDWRISYGDLVLEGTYGDSNLAWTYDSLGKLTLAEMASLSASRKPPVLNNSLRDKGMVAGPGSAGTTAINQAGGVITLAGNGAGMAAYGRGSTVVNRGTITLQPGDSATAGPLAGMAVYQGGTAVNDSSGVININAAHGLAFYSDGHAANRIINRGTINVGDGVPLSADNSLRYTVGTQADGTAGALSMTRIALTGVRVDTGFTAGTAAKEVVLQDAFVGEQISGEQNIRSTSVVWQAQAGKDEHGNIDITMTKNSYAALVTDPQASGVAQALDKGYTNNALYTSLNVSTTQALNKALKQISGSQATSLTREARMLSNRFSMLTDTAPQLSNGLAFNVVAQGDPRAELGNDVQYDMLALRKSLAFSSKQLLTMEFGIARLAGSGSRQPGDNGVTGGYSQFFGLQYTQPLGDALWRNALRYDVHTLDSRRAIRYDGVSKNGEAGQRQHALSFRSEAAKPFNLSESVTLTPFAGLALRHVIEEEYQERGAGDFNLNMGAGAETAVDAIAGLKLVYAGQNGWRATALLEGGPNLSYHQRQRSASLAGAAGQTFRVDDGQQGGGINGLAQVGLAYQSNDATLGLDAYRWKEDSLTDTGFMLSVTRTF
jgi:putative surface-exposed virulence protein